MSSANCNQRGFSSVSVLPAPLNGLSDALRILLPVVLVEVRGFHVRRRAGIGVVE